MELRGGVSRAHARAMEKDQDQVFEIPGFRFRKQVIAGWSRRIGNGFRHRRGPRRQVKQAMWVLVMFLSRGGQSRPVEHGPSAPARLLRCARNDRYVRPPCLRISEVN